MIAIVDYGVGHLFSLKSSIDALGVENCVTSDESVLREADKIILPGVGAFRDAIAKLRATGLDRVVVEEAQNGKDVMGICLGMQMLFEKSLEYGEWEGLGLLKGEIVPLKGYIPENLKIPHMGWNKLIFKKDTPIFKYIENGDAVYFVHSYHAVGCDESVCATSEYGAEVTAAVSLGNIHGCQFHPEKSGKTGLAILKAFCTKE